MMVVYRITLTTFLYKHTVMLLVWFPSHPVISHKTSISNKSYDINHLSSFCWYCWRNQIPHFGAFILWSLLQNYTTSLVTFQKRGKFGEYLYIVRTFVNQQAFLPRQKPRPWATKTEAVFLAESRGEIPDKSFGDLLDCYAREVSPTKRGARWEQIRLASPCEDPLAHVRLPQLTSRHFADWRDRRLAKFSAATVLREWNLLSNACTVAIREWHWLKENPLRDVRRPKQASSATRSKNQWAGTGAAFVDTWLWSWNHANDDIRLCRCCDAVCYWDGYAGIVKFVRSNGMMFF